MEWSMLQPANNARETDKALPRAIGLSLNKNLYRALHREARAFGISTAALIREIIKERMRDPRPLAVDPVYRSDGLKRIEALLAEPTDRAA